MIPREEISKVLWLAVEFVCSHIINLLSKVSTNSLLLVEEASWTVDNPDMDKVVLLLRPNI